MKPSDDARLVEIGGGPEIYIYSTEGACVGCILLVAFLRERDKDQLCRDLDDDGWM